MIIKYENLWNSRDDIILVTTNAFVKRNGELVMGRGAARELKERVPEISKVFGSWINNHCADTKKYGIMFYKSYGAFQVKYNWWESANLSLINYSTNMLIEILNLSTIMKTVSMNFPGVGNGKLAYEDVYPIVNKLPDTVSLYIK